jgi:hypothetical protein
MLNENSGILRPVAPGGFAAFNPYPTKKKPEQIAQVFLTPYPHKSYT